MLLMGINVFYTIHDNAITEEEESPYIVALHHRR